jgi:predicted nucleic acid-binding protein
VEYVVLDTDVASLSHKRRLPGPWEARLANKTPCITFVTMGEMTQWVELRNWAPRARAGLDLWLDSVVVLQYDETVARTWGWLSAAAIRRGRKRPANDMWIAACCLTEGLPLATRNVKDFADFADNHGLTILGPQ